jgi:hypothetical protein
MTTDCTALMANRRQRQLQAEEIAIKSQQASTRPSRARTRGISRGRQRQLPPCHCSLSFGPRVEQNSFAISSRLCREARIIALPCWIRRGQVVYHRFLAELVYQSNLARDAIDSGHWNNALNSDNRTHLRVVLVYVSTESIHTRMPTSRVLPAICALDRDRPA